MSDKRYPWSKLFSRWKRQNPAPIECVYAGPPPRNRPDPATDEVYAGPEYYERSAEEPDEPETPEGLINLVYAGPTFIEAERPQPRIVRPDDGEQPAEQPERPEEPAEPEESDELPPPPPIPAQDTQMFMCVYAGPAYYDAPAGDAQPQPAEEPEAPKEPADCVYCPNCGTPLPETSRFCTECSYRLKKEE